MKASGVIRGGGLAALVGGALWAALFAVYASRSPLPGPPYGSFDGLRVPGLLSLLLIALGFLGLDLPSWRGRGHGRLGRVGFDVALIGMFAIVVSGATWPVGLIGAWVLMVGSLMVGAAALLAGTLPRWGPWRSWSAPWRSSCSTPIRPGRGSRCRTGLPGWGWATCCGPAGVRQPSNPGAWGELRRKHSVRSSQKIPPTHPGE